MLRNSVRILSSSAKRTMAEKVTKPGQCKVMSLIGESRSSEKYARAVQEAARVLEEGGLVGVPTDTIYGIACLASKSESVKKIYDLKGRTETKPLAVCVPSVDSIPLLCKLTMERDLLHSLLPGPITLVFERTPDLNPDLNPTHDKVGVRIPQFPFIQDLCAKCSYPLALTSANYSSQPSTTSVGEFEHIWDRLNLVIDAGKVGAGTKEGSTVVDLSEKGRYKIIRPGCAMDSTVQVLREQLHLSESV